MKVTIGEQPILANGLQQSTMSSLEYFVTCAHRQRSQLLGNWHWTHFEVDD